MTDNNKCAYYPNCELCKSGEKCILKFPKVNKDILKLIVWEIEYKQHHNKPIELNKILDWYKTNYGVVVTKSELQLYTPNIKL